MWNKSAVSATPQIHIRRICLQLLRKQYKAVPAQAWTGLEGSRRSRFQHF